MDASPSVGGASASASPGSTGARGELSRNTSAASLQNMRSLTAALTEEGLGITILGAGRLPATRTTDAGSPSGFPNISAAERRRMGLMQQRMRRTALGLPSDLSPDSDSDRDADTTDSSPAGRRR